MKYLSAALAAACLLGGATAALAHPEQNQKRESVTLAVSTAGLDLRNPADAVKLRSRAARAIEQVCNPGDWLNADLSPDFRCRREMGAHLERSLRQHGA